MQYCTLNQTASEILWNRSQDTQSAWARIQSHTLAPVSSDPVIARMDAIALDGRYDKDADGLRRSRSGRVGDDLMMVQVAVMGQDTLLIFWSMADGHQRRFLVQTDGRVWMDTGRGAVRPQAANKCAEPISRVMAARAN